MTSFIGTTWQERDAWLKQEDYKNEQLDAIADHYEKRFISRRQHMDRLLADITRLRAELDRLEAKDAHERAIWHAVLDRHIARNKRISAMFDELKAAEATA